MKTLMLWQCEVLSGDEMAPKFLELEGDFSCYDNVYINADSKTIAEQDLQDELCSYIFTKEGKYKPGLTFLREPTKDWDIFIHCGFLP